jgi:hypothetical protein
MLIMFIPALSNARRKHRNINSNKSKHIEHGSHGGQSLCSQETFILSAPCGDSYLKGNYSEYQVILQMPLFNGLPLLAERDLAEWGSDG